MLSDLKSKLFTLIDDKIYHDPSHSKTTSPRNTILKWIVLAFCCLTTIGGYVAVDTIGPLQTPIMQTFDINVTQFNLLLTAVALPNCFMPLICGILVDKLGVRFGMLVYSAMIAIGQLIIIYGSNILSYNLILVGAVVVGIGLEGQYAAKNVMVIKWFKNQELAFPLGLTLTVSRFGSSLGFFVTPWLYSQSQSLTTAFWLGAIFAILSVVAVFFTNFFDLYAEEKEGKLEEGQMEIQEKFKLADVKEFQRILYILLIINMIGYGTILGFVNNGSDIMNSRFGSNPELSGKYMSIIFFIAMFLTPVFGRIVDKIGRRILLISMSLAAMAFVHIYIAFMKDTETGDVNTGIILALVLVGVIYSAYASIIWPCISLVVKDQAQGTANGLALAAENLCLGTLPLLVGVIHDNTIEVSSGYFYTEIFLASVAVLGLFFTNWARREDWRNGGVLEVIPKQRSSIESALLGKVQNIEMMGISHGKEDGV